VKAASYKFHSTWQLPATRSEVWQTLTAEPFSWQDWWPELSKVRNMKIAKGLSGSSFSCSWRAPLGYRLGSDIKIGKIVKPDSVTLHSDGDLRGTVTCQLIEKDSQTRIEIEWRVETAKAWMNYLTPLLRPIFVYSHHAVMRSGERGLRDYLNAELLDL
jgi:hypothetical protein